jgi:arginine utilization protein RocB
MQLINRRFVDPRKGNDATDARARVVQALKKNRLSTKGLNTLIKEAVSNEEGQREVGRVVRRQQDRERNNPLPGRNTIVTKTGGAMMISELDRRSAAKSFHRNALVLANAVRHKLTESEQAADELMEIQEELRRQCRIHRGKTGTRTLPR